jgi:putative ABC transport system substrate-binding protein
MRLTRLVVVLTLSLLVAPLPVGAQAGKVYRIGVLVPGSSAAAAPLVGVFRQGLRELGYVEGKNLVIELRYAETPVLLGQHADELTRLGVDVVVGTATPAALALKRATRTIPIVMGTASDPVQAGLVESLARPGSNITGSAVLFPEVTAKQMELRRTLRRLAFSLSGIGRIPQSSASGIVSRLLRSV